MSSSEVTDPSEAPLAGLKVVELSIYVQGPIAGLTLASLGAQVDKIEQVGVADYMRTFGGAFGLTFDQDAQDWFYSSLNRGKRSIALDVRTEHGRAVFHRMIRDADVFVTNLRASGLERLGADPETLCAVNPALVYCRGGGFALHGPLAEDPCQDTVGMAFGGFMDLTSTDGVPNYPPGSMSDILTGTAMASAVLAGLVKRSLTGHGSVVGTSQTQSLLWLQSQAVGAMANVGERMARFDAHEPVNPVFGVHRTSDGWIAVAALLEEHWPALVAAMNLDECLGDPRFASLAAVLTNAPDAMELLRPRFASETTDTWWRRLREAGVWVSPVHTLADIVESPDLRENDYLVTFPDGRVGPPAPFEVGGWNGARGSTATYGQHTDELLAELGYSEDEIVTMRVDQTIW